MATFNWPGFGISSISPTFDQPSQSNSSSWTGTRTVITDPWHGKWSFKVTLATQQGDGAFQAIRAFFTSLKGQINTFHLPAVEAPQNANTGVTINSTTGQGQVATTLAGVTTALVAGNMVTVNGQLLSIISVSGLSAGTQVINFEPALRAAATAGTSVETARPYALVYLSDSSFTWDIGQWRRYGLTFSAAEAVGETDGASSSGDIWNATFSGSGGSSGPTFTGVAVQKDGGTLSQVSTINVTGAALVVAGSTATISPLVTPQQYGTVDPTGVADSSAAFLAALAALKAAAVSGYGYSNLGGPKLFIPSGVYYLGSTTLDLTHGIIIEGESTGYTGSGTSVLKWATGTTGIRFEQANTSGTTTVASRGYSSHPILRNLTLYSTYSGTESEAHAIDMRCDGAVENVGIFNFAGDGIHIVATAGSGAGTEGNANGWFLKRVCIQGCRSGLHIDGADVNAGMATALNLISNRRWGIWDSSFLGNTHIGHQAAGNGAVSGTHPPSWVSQGGNRYVVIAGQETGASTNAPSGTTADNTWWYYYSAGAPDTTINCPAWVTGTTYRSGGSYLTDDTGNAGNVFTSCYIEGSQPFAQLVTPTLVLGGSMNPNVKGVPILIADSSNIKSTNGLAALGSLTILGNTNALGPQSGTAADSVVNLYNTNVSSVIQGTSATSGIIGSLNFRFGTGNIYNVSNAAWSHVFQINGTEVARFSSAGLTLTPVAVASLPAAGTVGRRSFVTDANATTFASVVAGGGTNKIPVYDDGTSWRIG